MVLEGWSNQYLNRLAIPPYKLYWWRNWHFLVGAFPPHKIIRERICRHWFFGCRGEKKNCSGQYPLPSDVIGYYQPHIDIFSLASVVIPPEEYLPDTREQRSMLAPSLQVVTCQALPPVLSPCPVSSQRLRDNLTGWPQFYCGLLTTWTWSIYRPGNW